MIGILSGVCIPGPPALLAFAELGGPVVFACLGNHEEKTSPTTIGQLPKMQSFNTQTVCIQSGFFGPEPMSKLDHCSKFSGPFGISLVQLLKVHFCSIFMHSHGG